MEARLVGWFRELTHGMPDGPSLASSANPEPSLDESNVMAYLQAGCVVVQTLDYLPSDPLDSSYEPAEYFAVLTDGTWVWPNDLPHHVVSHHVTLPSEFIDHARRNGWMIPELSQAQLAEIYRDVYREE